MVFLKILFVILLCGSAGGLLYMAIKLHGPEPVAETIIATNMLFAAFNIVKTMKSKQSP